MNKALCIGVYNTENIHQASPMCGDNVFAKGLEANGFEVKRLDYRGERLPNKRLLELADEFKPDIFWFGKCERIELDTLKELRSSFSVSTFVKWAADVRRKPVKSELEFNRFMDWYFATFGGDWLKSHLVHGMKGVGSIVSFVDGDIFKSFKSKKEWGSDVLFTGRTNMRAQVDRARYLEFLKSRGVNLKWFGQKNWIGNPEYLWAINSTKIGLGINHFIRPLYSSDRLGTYTACGAFYLSQYFPGIEQVFPNQSVDWFRDAETCYNKIKYYLKNEGERERKAIEARKRVLKFFNYKPLVGNLLNIIRTGESKYDWDNIFLNK